MLNDIVEKLLKDKGVDAASEDFLQKKQELTERLQSVMAEASVEAMFDDRLEMLDKAIENSPNDTEGAAKIVAGSELRVDVLKKAFSDFCKEYMEEA